MLVGVVALLATAALPEHVLVAGGDVNLARHTHLALDAAPANRLLAPIASEIRSADFAMANLECVVSTRGAFHRKPENRPYFYRARPEMLDAMTDVGMDFLAVANNHSLDFGPEALLEQLELLEAAGIAYAGGGQNLGAAMRPAYVTVGDVVLAIFGADASVPPQRYFGATAGRPGTFQVDLRTTALVDRLRGAIQEARRHAHIVIVSPHWGGNWTEGPSEDMRRAGRGLIEAGADVVLGHSSHQIHGVEIHQGKLIVWDMGSLLFDRTGQSRMRKGLLFRLRFTRAGVHRLEVLPIRVANNVTRRAIGTEAEEIRTLFRDLTSALDPDLPIEDGEEGWLTVPVPEGSEREIAAAPEARPTGRTRRLPDALRTRRPNVFVEKMPRAFEDGRPQDIGGVELLGALLPQSVPENHDVIVELFLRAKAPLSGRKLVVLSGGRRDTDCQFGEWAEPGDWAVPTERWGAGEIVRHRIALRSVAACGTGTFDLDVQLVPSRGESDTPKVRVGSFLVAPSERSRQPLVEPRVPFVPGRSPIAVVPTVAAPVRRAWLWATFAGVAIVLCAVTVAVIRRRRRAPAVTRPPGGPAA